ncbi:MAG: undecaprenyl-diphosphate phosphatase [Lentimicrobium sp.]|uniref:undecaprenyl-diphosphate phosphatase n=1 Tax=Lentimicrobium sp. TaxID=2034841 RepID=UPI0025E8E486|nr:undecaprenyl-diphosphate phosphatase [Lentimicrobium sp.]MCO5257066.1 undecaprenyl-diphosphate phosphatase [Lentimicrobium sp.]MCO5262480.1 undecaprenyl-diphosphate phosphatase [Lentimicrobium sp.]
MTVIEAIIIAIVEGITEFLPVSSTGHMIITQELLGMKIDDFVKAFTVNIQFGAILSVVVLYWKRFFQSLQFYYKLFVAFIPAAVIGFLAGDFIDSMLESVVVVAVMLVLGGVVLVFVDKWFNKPVADQTVTYPTAFKIGLFQCIAMIPGVSRSAATIIGGMTQKLDRKTAAEFSFFLAVPTMFAAAGYKLMQNYQTITAENIDILLIGNAVAFVVAMIAIKSFISFLTKYGFRVFGYYRILVGLAILIMIALGYDLNIA